MKAVRIHEFGGLDVLKWEDVDRPTPRPNQVLIKVDAAGVNYADLMRRRGGYPGPDLPSTLGLEAAGTIAELGESVSGLTVGQRVMGMGPQGNAEYVAVNANFVFPYPETIDPIGAGGSGAHRFPGGAGGQRLRHECYRLEPESHGTASRRMPGYPG